MSSTNSRFPFTTGGTIRCVCYVWRPSTQTIVGTILDNVSATITRTADTTERNIHTTFSGSAVSSVQDGDVIIFEVWVSWTQAASVTSNNLIYYDGTTANTTNNSSVSNHASFIETPQTLTFTASVTRLSVSKIYKYNIQELPITCTPTGKIIYNKSVIHG